MSDITVSNQISQRNSHRLDIDGTENG